MIKLTGITLINWYLFAAEDIPITGDIILFKGVNGTGKSSLLDGIQTAIAGGDENAVRFNTSSGDGHKSARSLRDYVLCAIEEEGVLRAESNSYLCLNFQDERTEKRYAMGLSIHARKSHTKVVKDRFIVVGTNLNRLDFLSDDAVLPWKDVQARLSQLTSMHVEFPSTATQYRERCAEVLSRASIGSENRIQPDVLLATIMKAVGFKEQKDVNLFIREFILARQEIDIEKIRQDHVRFRDMERLTRQAKQRMEELKIILQHCNTAIRATVRYHAYRWLEMECNALGQKSTIDQLVEQQDQQANAKDRAENQREKLAAEVAATKTDRDNALTALDNARNSSGLENLMTRRNNILGELERITSNLSEERGKLAKLAKIDIANAVSAGIRLSAIKIIGNLKIFAEIGGDQLLEWEPSESALTEASKQLEILARLTGEIEQEERELTERVSSMSKDIKADQGKVAALKQGKAPLRDATEKLVNLLRRNGIDAKPVCDLVEINDSSWQEAVERYLGGNREALVVSEAAVEKAVAIHREEMKHDKSIRPAKVINPGKDFGFYGEPDPATAASLIESKNTVARAFLRGLLHNVRLVETEAQLLKERRAITRDGLIAGSGTLSGGAKDIDLLIGKKIRQESARKLEQTLTPREMEFNEANDALGEITKCRKALEFATRDSEVAVQQIPNLLAKRQEKNNELTAVDERISAVDRSELNSFENTFKLADKAHDEALEIQQGNETAIKIADREIQMLKAELTPLQTALQRLENAKTGYSTQNVVEANLANELLEKLEDEKGDDYPGMTEVCRERWGSASHQAENEKGEVAKKLGDYLHEHHINDRSIRDQSLEAISLWAQQHCDHIEQSEIAVYENQAARARQSMVAAFRSEVVNKLKNNFNKLETTFNKLNQHLRGIEFNDNEYSFRRNAVQEPRYQDIKRFIDQSDDLDSADVGQLFDEASNDPALDIIEEMLVDSHLDELCDYRNYYTYDIVAKDIKSHTERRFSRLLQRGSGGEKQTPFYVALGASFMNAYKLEMGPHNSVLGGVALALFDEAFSKMDGNNSASAIQFFRKIGLQVLMAAPPEMEVKIGHCTDTVYNMIKDGHAVFLDSYRYTEQGAALMESDNPVTHPEIVQEYLQSSGTG